MEAMRNTSSPHGETYIFWEVDEYPRYGHSFAWYVGAGLVGLGFLWYSLATVNFLFALIVIIFAIVVVLSSTREPHKVRVALTEDGIELGTRFYPYRDYESFWLVYEPPLIKTLYLEPRSSMRPPFGVPLEDANPNTVRQILMTNVREDLQRNNEPFADSLARLLRI
jgi:hypothetical protein